MTATPSCPHCGHEAKLVSRFCEACGRDRRTADPGTWNEEVRNTFAQVYRSAGTRAKVAVVVLGLIALLSLASLLHNATGFGLVADARAGTLTDADATAFDTTTAALGGVYGVLVLAAAIAFLAWLSRSVDNVEVLGGGTPMATPRWSIGWWFVPIANLFKPFQVVEDLNQRMATRLRSGGDRLVLAWWLLWIGGGIISAIVSRLPNQETLEGLNGFFTAMILGHTIELTAALLAIAVIRQIQQRADERSQDAEARGAATEASSEGSGGAGPLPPPCPRCGSPREVGRQLCPTCGLDLWADYDRTQAGPAQT